jgi:signal peptidase I
VNQDTGEPGNSRLKRFITDILVPVLVAAAVYFAMQFTVESRDVVGPSMQPSFQQGDYIMVSKVAYFNSKPQRGDVIVLRPVGNPGADLIKRVIAIPKDMVEVKNHKVIVNGVPLDEPYISEPPTYGFGPLEVEKDQYFVLGDNRNVSRDSHYGWTVPLDHIVGKVWFVYWPMSRVGGIPHYTYNIK